MGKAIFGVPASLTELAMDQSPMLVLGIGRDPAPDKLMPDPPRLNERLLTEVARFFDHAGFMEPVIVRDKIIIQSLLAAGLY